MITKNKMERPHYNWLRIVLAEKEKTGTRLSELMGRNIGTESRWMTNKVQPSVEHLYAYVAFQSYKNNKVANQTKTPSSVEDVDLGID